MVSMQQDDQVLTQYMPPILKKMMNKCDFFFKSNFLKLLLVGYFSYINGSDLEF